MNEDALVGAASLNDAKRAIRRKNLNTIEHLWTHTETMNLIKAVKQRRALWDFNSLESKCSKTKAWKEVSDAIGNATVNDVKTKWMHLRISFKNSLAKYRYHGEGFVIKWRFFKSLMFLEAYDHQQSTESTSSSAVVIFALI